MSKQNKTAASRRSFLQKTAVGLAGITGLPLIGSSTAFANAGVKKGGQSLPIGIAGYTFYQYELDQAIAMMKRLNLSYLSVKDKHLPLNSSEEKIKAVLKQCEEGNIKVYTVGVIYMKTKQAVDEAFEYAKKVGVNMIVGVPTYDLLDYSEEKVKAYDIKLAIHNHGPEDALYPSPQNVYERIKDRDSRMGLCMDIGHAVRAGADVPKSIKAYKDRLFDLHIKDVSAAAKDAKAIEMGRGVIDFAAVIKMLEKINYQGVCSIEYEKDMKDLMPGLAESVGFFRGAMATVNEA